jgi:hypothetical protein
MARNPRKTATPDHPATSKAPAPSSRRPVSPPGQASRARNARPSGQQEDRHGEAPPARPPTRRPRRRHRRDQKRLGLLGRLGAALRDPPRRRALLVGGAALLALVSSLLDRRREEEHRCGVGPYRHDYSGSSDETGRDAGDFDAGDYDDADYGDADYGDADYGDADCDA